MTRRKHPLCGVKKSLVALSSVIGHWALLAPQPLHAHPPSHLHWPAAQLHSPPRELPPQVWKEERRPRGQSSHQSALCLARAAPPRRRAAVSGRTLQETQLSHAQLSPHCVDRGRAGQGGPVRSALIWHPPRTRNAPPRACDATPTPVPRTAKHIRAAGANLARILAYLALARLDAGAFRRALRAVDHCAGSVEGRRAAGRER